MTPDDEYAQWWKQSHDRLIAASGTLLAAPGPRALEQATAELSRHNPQGRLVAPPEVADAVLWLCGKGASAITGQAIAVAGGEV